MYQAEIKRRWDQRAQIKDKYVFPRIKKVRDRRQTEQPQMQHHLQDSREVVEGRPKSHLAADKASGKNAVGSSTYD